MVHLFAVGIFILGFSTIVFGHGRLIDPPSRSSMWRYGFSTPPNYNDHELYCGGFTRQWKVNGGKCGICGDAWDDRTPRANEAGGKYGKGIIVRKYITNSVVRLRVELTANHMGYFEFRLCPNNNVKKVASQKCLDTYLLQKSDGTGPRFYPGSGNKVFESMYRLPKGLTCSQCVLQWKYVAGNNWGICENGTGLVGCGPQEQFRACADVAITDDEGNADDTTYFDDNEVDNEIGGKDGSVSHESEKEGPVYIGIIIAVMALVVALMIFLLLFLWYYRGKDFVKSFLKEKNMKNADSSEKGDLFYAVTPVSRPPMPPPRTRRKDSGSMYTTPAVLSISQPTNVTVNGVALKS